ncbi:MAG: anthranilate phosphoribosyltransferase [Verrucomicrobia bacterium]|nr:anthranilate phosphoribosyltransferase [Verrucomicrobiota bacterium]
MLSDLTELVATRRNLNPEQAMQAVEQLTAESVPAHIKAVFLTRLAEKGESPEEIASFANALRQKSIKPPIDATVRAGEILDVCGTGGDRLNTFNISTTVAIVAAAAGVCVAKHGNRAITSASGSADVLEALGIRIQLSPEEAARWLKEHNFAFFFAQAYHPAFKHIAPARKLCAEKGQRTLFNFLGPLLNPAAPTSQLLGVARPHLCEPLAAVLQGVGVRRAMVVCGDVDGMYLDELSTLGPSTVVEFYQPQGLASSRLQPSSLPIQPCKLEDLMGGTSQVNAQIIKRIFRREELGPKRDAVLLNAGAALFVASKVRSITEGWDLAAEVIDSGKASAKLAELVKASSPS